MDSKSATTIKGVKELGGELSAWEARTAHLQMESENLKRKNDQTKKDIEQALALGQQELDKKREAARLEGLKISEASAKLEADKADFAKLLINFKQDKNGFETERTKIEDLHQDTLKLREKLGNFIVWFKREAEKL